MSVSLANVRVRWERYEKFKPVKSFAPAVCFYDLSGLSENPDFFSEKKSSQVDTLIGLAIANKRQIYLRNIIFGKQNDDAVPQPQGSLPTLVFKQFDK